MLSGILTLGSFSSPLAWEEFPIMLMMIMNEECESKCYYVTNRNYMDPGYWKVEAFGYLCPKNRFQSMPLFHYAHIQWDDSHTPLKPLLNLNQEKTQILAKINNFTMCPILFIVNPKNLLSEVSETPDELERLGPFVFCTAIWATKLSGFLST